MTTGVGEDRTDLLKVPEVAKRLGVSEPTVWRLIKSGEMDSIKVSARSRRIAPEVVEAYLRERSTSRRGAA